MLSLFQIVPAVELCFSSAKLLIFYANWGPFSFTKNEKYESGLFSKFQGVSNSTFLPFSRTRMRSYKMIVFILCAIVMTVVLANSVLIIVYIMWSVASSILAVASLYQVKY